MATNYRDTDAVCPYYRRDKRTRVICEGMGQDGAIEVVFAKEDEKEAHRALYCDSFGYGACMICQMLDRKYECVK